MPVLFTRASEEHFFIRKTDIIRYVTFKEIPLVIRFFGFPNVVLDAVKEIVYYY